MRRTHDLRTPSRREFLRTMAAGSVAMPVMSAPWARALGAETRRAEKTIVVTFGGGARDEETFAEDGQENIPHLLTELLPQGTFFPQVVNRGILGHYVATASIVTGRYETFNNFVAQPPQSPTLFEYFRKGLGRPANDAWVVAPSNGFQRLGASDARGFGEAYGAGVILPKQLLNASIPETGRTSLEKLQHLLQDNYEMPVYQPTLATEDRELHLSQLSRTLNLSVGDFVAHSSSLTSPDELSIYITRHLMDTTAPSLMLLTLHDMDVAHAGAYSLYIEAIKRADRLCAELWQMVQTHAEYKDRTRLLIMPDFGRDADDDLSGNGFQHHRTGSALARTTWLLALGPGVRQNAVVDRPLDAMDLVPTVGSRMGFATPLTTGRPIVELA